MVEIKTLALVMLFGHAVSVAFVVLVLIKQVRLFELPIDAPLRGFRRLLFGAALAILAINVIPIAIDLLTLFVPIDRPARVSPIGVAYALSNSLLAAVLSMLVWLLYRTAAKSHKKP